MNDYVTDVDRLAEVGSFDLFSPEANAALNAWARQVAERFNMPMAMVSIVLDGAQYHAGSYGVDGWIAEVQGIPVEWSFCATVVRTRRRYVVEDAAHDERQRDNPLVAMIGSISYAGVPLTTTAGHVLGTLCMAGAPRTFSTTELDQLEQMANALMLALPAAETVDPVTALTR